MTKIKIVRTLAIFSSLLMVLMMITPTFAINGPRAHHLQYKFYGGQTALFTGLLNNEIDMMAWPLTYAQYQTAITTTNITVAPYFDLGGYEIAFNNNETDPSHAAERKAMNYTEFRQAIACLVDKDTLVGVTVNGFGTRIDTQMARPILNPWVDLNPASPTCVSKYDANGNLINKYPWDYSETNALTILWNNNWYSHTTYPTLASLLTAPTPIPQDAAHGCVYPPGHPRAGQLIDVIVAYIRSDHVPRKTAGENLVAEMTKYGIPNSGTTHEGPSSVCYTPVFVNHDYDFYTSGWSFGAHPLHFYSMNTPIGIYPGGPNLYMIDDWNMTYHAEQEYPLDTVDTPASSAYAISQAKMCQYRQVMEAMLCPLYTSASYMAYKTGTVGIINFRGYGLTTALEYTLLNARTAPYTSPMTIRYGTLNPPVSINPIFSSWLWDYEVVDRIFNRPMATNPYQSVVVGKSPSGGDLPWMAYDWNFQLSNFNGGGGLGNPANSYTNMANVTYWFRHDITWHDGVPWTVDDFNYTIYIDAAYGDSWGHSDMAHVVNFVKWNSWTCSLYFDIPTFWTLYTATYDEVPKHIYEKIDIPAGAAGGGSTTGHHGEWPGADALAGEIHAPLTFPVNPEEVWVGTGMWQYVPLTYVSGTGGGLICDPYPGFWMQMAGGDIDLKYTWNAGPAPQNGSYVVGFSDLVLLANAYGTSGNGHPVPFKIGGLGVWEPGCDMSPPAGSVGLSDLISVAFNYGRTWGWGPAPGPAGGGNGGSGALVSVVPNLVELGPAPVVGQNFTIAVLVQNVTPANVPAGLDGVEIHFSWDPTLIQPLSYVDKIGVSGGVLTGPLLYAITPGFFDDVGNRITGPPYTGATNYRVAAIGNGAAWYGNGTAAEITFQVIYQPSPPEPSASCSLEFGYVSLLAAANEVGFQRENGQYTILPITHDVAVTGVSPSKVVVGQGYSTFVNVTVENQGGYTEDFNVTAYANTTAIGTQPVNNLFNQTSTVLTFEWNTTGFSYGDYALEAVADTVPNETNTANNNMTVGITVTIPGDLNGDFKVSLSDLVLLANAYGSIPGDAKWNPNADINGDGKVSLQDLVIMANHYGQHYP